ncbi:hypothetical protein SK066_02515 [Paenibacillus hunanensis]|uniref:hypothetical protein n=1 Tax=Paenibacillus hunanensis TaxID=539262 RepID=UPI002A6A65A0|nr:hypothetical protein [Paenibacillus hunanensis]WPP41857.1 hypothetical protein SK066_02515 [Paenibacillus hunanensis]
MTNQQSVSYKLKMELVRQGYTLSSFSKLSGINRGVLSSTLNDPPTRSLSMNQINQMNQALNFPVGWLYEEYAQELIADIETVSWRKIKDLLTHCVQIKKMNLIQTVLDALKDTATYMNYIFDLAEELIEQELIEQGEDTQLSMFYQYILDHESNLHAERFAISQYRLFRISLGLDVHKILKWKIQFAPQRHALPFHLKLDALAQLSNVAFAFKEWDELRQYGEELVATTMMIYNSPPEYKYSCIKKAERSLLVYYGKGHIAQAAGWEYSGNYEEAQKMISYYEDLSWFEFTDPTDKIQLEKFYIIAKCNRYNTELYLGNNSVLKSYIDYLEFFPEEQPASIEVIIKTSIMYGWDIDDILEKYHDVIYPPDISQYLQTTTYYSIFIELNRYTTIYHDLALYYFERKGSTEQLEHVLSTLKSHIEKYDRIHTFDSTELFEKLYKFYF